MNSTVKVKVKVKVKVNNMGKQELIGIVNRLPETATTEDVLYCLYTLIKHNKAMDDITYGNVFSSEEVRSSIGLLL